MRRVAAGELTREDALLGIEHFWAGALRRAVIDGDVETGSVMAGQSVGMVTSEQPIAAIIGELVDQARRRRAVGMRWSSLPLREGAGMSRSHGQASAKGPSLRE